MLDRYISLVLIAASGASLYNAIHLAGGAGGVRGAIFPLALTAGLGVCSIILLLATFRVKAPATARPTAAAAGATGPASAGPTSAPAPAAASAPASAPAASAQSDSPVTPERMKQSLLFFLFVLIFIALVEPLGFTLAAALMGTVVLRFSFREPWWQAVLIAVVLALAGWLLFQRILLVPLPEGILRGVLG